MTYKSRKDSRHITLRSEAIKIYDKWKDDGESSKVSEAIIQYFDGKDGVRLTDADKEWIRQEINKAVKEMGKEC